MSLPGSRTSFPIWSRGSSRPNQLPRRPDHSDTRRLKCPVRGNAHGANRASLHKAELTQVCARAIVATVQIIQDEERVMRQRPAADTTGGGVVMGNQRDQVLGKKLSRRTAVKAATGAAAAFYAAGIPGKSYQRSLAQ